MQTVSRPHRAAIALGSNLGDRHAAIARAIEMLGERPDTVVEAVSTLRETAPVGDPDQGDFLNGAVVVRTGLSPHALLECLLAIERVCGRVRDPSRRNGPRTIDLDLALFDEVTVDTDNLVVPHPRLAGRAFVLEPLCEIAPEWWVPLDEGAGTVRELWNRCRVSTEGGV